MTSGLLSDLKDWVVLCDGISNPYNIPHDIVVTAFRPDIFLYSYTGKKCILVELTVPFEDRVFIAAEGKARKYKDLQYQIISAGYDCRIYTVEVGCRGNYAASLHDCLMDLGFPRKHANRVCRSAKTAPLRCSCYIYLKRTCPIWSI